MTTNNEQNEPRNINQLLALDSYQTMTDEEIEAIIEYKVNFKYEMLVTSELMKQAREESMQKIAILRETCANSNAMLESILEQKPQLHGIGDSNE